jgi:broad specificity phosphatase PhoE
MGTIYLIRHGQAGFGQADYDVLSPLGATQAEKLGGYLALAQLPVDTLWSAPRRRHRETAAAMREGAASAGGALPEVHSIPAAAFDEFPFAEILAAACSADLADEYAALSAELGGANPLTDGRAFSRLFVRAMRCWVAGTVSAPETFPGFVSRVGGGLRELCAQEGRGRRIAVVTSAGAIAAAVMHALELSPERMLRLCLSLHNTSLTELRYKGGELSLMSFNSVPHLFDPAHRTLR